MMCALRAEDRRKAFYDVYTDYDRCRGLLLPIDQVLVCECGAYVGTLAIVSMTKKEL